MHTVDEGDYCSSLPTAYGYKESKDDEEGKMMILGINIKPSISSPLYHFSFYLCQSLAILLNLIVIDAGIKIVCIIHY